jgi:hypothetical protein
MMRRILVATILAAALAALTPAAARAATLHGYVCEVIHIAGPPEYGAHGYVHAQVRSQPACAGTFVATLTVCSTGATAAGCGQVLSEPAVLAFWAALREAAAVGQRLKIETIVAGAKILQYVFFRAD